MARLLFLAFGMILALFAAAHLIGRPPSATAAATVAASPPPISIPNAGDIPQRNAFAQVTVVDRDASGRFALSGEINGRSQELLVDTGADLVAIAE